MTAPIISLSGKKGSGKDTVALMFKELLPKYGTKEIQIVGFADKLKKVCADALEINSRYFNDLKELKWPRAVKLQKRQGRKIMDGYNILDHRVELILFEHLPAFLGSGREMLQFVGTDLLRSVDDQIHLKNLPVAKTHIATVVTDARFPNEIEYLEMKSVETNQKYLSIYIDRPGLPEDGHASEQLDPKLCDITIKNEKGLEELKAGVATIIEDYL